MTPWSPLALTFKASNGTLTQLYNPSCTAGTGATTSGTEKRTPLEGRLFRCEVESDGANGGEIQLWDVNGAEGGADVDTLTVITNAQLLALVAAGRARLIWQQTFAAAAGSSFAIAGTGMPFSHGLAARFVAAAGGCTLSLVVGGGCRKIQICG